MMMKEWSINLARLAAIVGLACGLSLVCIAPSLADDAKDKKDEKSGAMDHSHMHMDHSQMDHSQMDHSQMDHSQMDHSQMDHDSMNHEQMDHAHMHHDAGKPGVYKTSMMSVKVPDVRMLDKDRKTVRLAELVNGEAPVMLNFIYTTCTAICPVMTSTFQQVQGLLGDKRGSLRMVSISIDPENDTPERLAEYGQKFGMDDTNWLMLTGKLADSIQVQKAFGAYAGEKMNHKATTFIKPQGKGKQWLRIDGLAKPADIVKEYDKITAGKIK